MEISLSFMPLNSELKNIQLDSLSDNPMYKQMADGLRHLIVTGKVQAGTALPTGTPGIRMITAILNAVPSVHASCLVSGNSKSM